MKILGILLAAGAATGCRSYVKLSDVEALRGDREDVVLRFKADRDVTSAAQFIQARLGVPAQTTEDAFIGPDRLTREAGVFRASFPLRNPGLYDLTRPGLHDLEFQVSGANCGGPGGFYTDRLKVPYRAP